ncbi:hypothetical protein [Tychonema sp. BBK16]|uniref:hypothetical protein n=1 Tax=Tychonema sp. BBK16 TaxID=2699888 RepID=UPI001F1F573E|nr:hypothetical protein [Tychonema sp. BBK16]MCF6374396.1 hypothetical protein [Tychonema sp. BBK16]
MILNSLLIIPENNLISTVADKGKPLRDKIADSRNKKITEKYVQLSLFDFDNQQRLISDNNQYYTHIKNFIELLENVNVIYFDFRTNIYEFSRFIKPDNLDRRLRIPIMLGYIAEGMVVRECNSDVSKNAKWANIARLIREDTEDTNLITSLVKKFFWYPFLQNPNHYHAIGTGLAITKNTQDLRKWHLPSSKRDICWVDSATKVKELLIPKNIIRGKLEYAGIQVKVSTMSNGWYVTNHFKTECVYDLYPVVYFDLGGDFLKVRHNLLNLSVSDVSIDSLFSSNVEFSEKISRSDIVDMMLHRGRDVDASLHDELLYYKSIFHRLESGKITLMNLINDDKLISCLSIDYATKNAVCDSSLLTIPYIS